MAVDGWAGVVEQVQLGDHVCALVDGTDDVLDVISRAVTGGVAGHDKVVVFTEALAPDLVWGGLAARGVRLDTERRTGQVRIVPTREPGLVDGRFEASRVRGDIDRAAAEGYRGLRVVDDMAWALDEGVGPAAIARYETEVNRLYLDGDASGICLYDRRAYPVDLLRQAARAHPTTTAAGAAVDWVPTLRVRRTVDPYGLRLIGEADLSNRQAVAAALDAVGDGQPDPAVPIVIDVTGLRFADASTAALVGRFALRAPAGVHLTGCHDAIQAVLDRVGVTRLAGLRVTAAAGPGSPETEMFG